MLDATSNKRSATENSSIDKRRERGDGDKEKKKLKRSQKEPKKPKGNPCYNDHSNDCEYWRG
jgi:hypothetical protein